MKKLTRQVFFSVSSQSHYQILNSLLKYPNSIDRASLTENIDEESVEFLALYLLYGRQPTVLSQLALSLSICSNASCCDSFLAQNLSSAGRDEKYCQ